jgi:hypothetical protein
MFGKWMIVFLTCLGAAQCAPLYLVFEDDNHLATTQQQSDDELFNDNALSEEDRSLLSYFDSESKDFFFKQ